MSAEDQPIAERVEFPSIPREVRNKLVRIREELDRAQVEQLRKSIPLFNPIFKKREEEFISLPDVKSDFWARVFSCAPEQIADYIQREDSEIFDHLTNFKVERFEVDEQGNGEPRSLRFTFEFNPEENEHFDNAKLVKEFYWRKRVYKTASGKRYWVEGLVSEPVRINWKTPEDDPTEGLLDAACDLFEAEKKKGGKRSELPEYEALVKKIEAIQAEAMKDENEEEEGENAELPEDEDDDENPFEVSFFAFFGFRGMDITAEQNVEAIKEDEERWAKISKGEAVPEDEGNDDDEDDEYELPEDDLGEVEIFPDGEDFAEAIASELWTNALQCYEQSFQPPAFIDFGDLDMDIDESDEGEDEGEERPAKKARTGNDS